MQQQSRRIGSESEMQRTQFGEYLDLGHAFPAYYSNKGTTNGKKWGQPVYWTLRRDNDSILEEETVFDAAGPRIIGVTCHDKGLSGNYPKFDAWLSGIEGKRAA